MELSGCRRKISASTEQEARGVVAKAKKNNRSV
jgi:hypothetical protein